MDQLEGRHCKDTQKCWPFYIGAPKGPFSQGLRENPGKAERENNTNERVYCDNRLNVGGGVRAVFKKRQKKEAFKAANCFKINRKRSANSYTVYVKNYMLADHSSVYGQGTHIFLHNLRICNFFRTFLFLNVPSSSFSVYM